MTTKSTAKKTIVAAAVNSVIEAVTMDAAAIDKAMANVIAQSMGLQDAIQEVAVAIMLHTYHHNDFSRAQSLVDGLGKGVRRVALVEWFKMAGLKVDIKTEKFNGFNRQKMEDKWAKCKAEPWFTFKPERPFAGFDLQAELERLLSRAEKASEKNAATPEAERAEDYKFSLDATKLAALRAMVQPGNMTIN